jgi:hypothetical protein
MSTAELPGLISQLNECMEMLNKVEAKASTVRAEYGEVRGELRELEYISYRVISLMGRMGLPEDVQRSIQLIQRLILIARMLHTVMILLNTEGMGTIIGLITLAGTFVTIAGIGSPYDDNRGS